ncbi:TetR/AcrR family transcriptional regulator [Mycobacterium sp. OTB74]|uniref:TetR/AcrR family transcriptional regulator n=1 Tax=Mycobacterium sp. OTB74 TaxID=1853452 RepID=UPI0024770D79|nr:TetR/AcrR family transcriptional regulator [Mycobacterium sp. OTB74]MDH6247483.1 AcrR family transcriptional regulator [Mycobacterium sp. OTB74]
MPYIATRGPGRPPAAKAAETRERIVHAAREVFSELGYDAATFQAIAVRADLTRPAINHYFVNKRVLYREVLDQTSEAVVAAGRRRAEDEPTFLKRLSAFFVSTIQADTKDRWAAAFLVTSILESQRHPELREEEHNPLTASREFMTWAVADAIERGELTVDTDVETLVEMLVAVLWGMGFYAGYVGSEREAAAVVERLELLLANKLWQITD